MNCVTDISDSQWQIIEKFFDSARKRKHDLRDIWNGILYLLKSGCQWRMLPQEFAPWQTVYYYYRKWKYAGIIEIILDEITYLLRKQAGKNAAPTVCIIDSHSAKTTGVGGFCIGYDAGKKVKGRKRHVVVDTMGNLLTVEVHSASLQDRNAGEAVIAKAKTKFGQLKVVYADGGYSGSLEEKVKQNLKIDLKIVKKIKDGFHVLPKRWIVERSLAWMNNDRRNSKDYEYSPLSSETLVQLSMIRVGLNRIFK
jgi:putative transposase